MTSTQMTYDYAARRIWLDDAIGETRSGGYGLCEVHAGRMTPPVTWTLVDRRERAPVLPFQRDIA